MAKAVNLQVLQLVSIDGTDHVIVCVSCDGPAPIQGYSTMDHFQVHLHG